MNGIAHNTDYQDHYEYHGNTTIEFTRKSFGRIIHHDWLLFDSIDEAQTFFNDTAFEETTHHV